jgi:hypothetical protein
VAALPFYLVQLASEECRHSPDDTSASIGNARTALPQPASATARALQHQPFIIRTDFEILP